MLGALPAPISTHDAHHTGGHLPHTTKCVLHSQLPGKPRRGKPQPPFPETWASQGCEDDGTCFSRSLWSGCSQARGCHWNDGVDPLWGATASWMPPKCPCPNPVHEEGCLKPAPNLPSLTGLHFGSGKGISSLLQGRTFDPKSGPHPAGCADLSLTPRCEELV